MHSPLTTASYCRGLCWTRCSLPKWGTVKKNHPTFSSLERNIMYFARYKCHFEKVFTVSQTYEQQIFFLDNKLCCGFFFLNKWKRAVHMALFNHIGDLESTSRCLGMIRKLSDGNYSVPITYS